jgi:hypothetical protein
MLAEQPLEPIGDRPQAAGESARRGRHPAVKPGEQEVPVLAPERDDVGLEKVFRHVVVKRAFSRAHLVIELARVPGDKRLVEKLLRLPPERPLHDRRRRERSSSSCPLRS